MTPSDVLRRARELSPDNGPKGISLALREVFEDFKGTEKLSDKVEDFWLEAIEAVGTAVLLPHEPPGPGSGRLQYNDIRALDRAIKLAEKEETELDTVPWTHGGKGVAE